MAKDAKVTDEKRISVDFPLWMLAALDDEAGRLGIPRQAVIKMWIDEKIRERGLCAG